VTDRLSEGGRSSPERRRGARDTVGNPRLWVTVGLVMFCALAWQSAYLLLGRPETAESVDFLPLGVFLIPVLYASISFGLGGGMAVAAVSALATAPWVVDDAVRRDGAGAWLELMQVVVLVVVAYFVGKGVRDERQARLLAELSRHDHLLAEIRYRDLFDTNSQPILLTALSGEVQEANRAAEQLFFRRPGALGGVPLSELVGDEVAAALLDGRMPVGSLDIGPSADLPPVAVLRPVGRSVTIGGQPMLQVVL